MHNLNPITRRKSRYILDNTNLNYQSYSLRDKMVSNFLYELLDLSITNDIGYVDYYGYVSTAILVGHGISIKFACMI